MSNSALVVDLFLKNNNIKFISTGGKLKKDFDSFIDPQARESYLLVDSTKFGQVSTVKWFELKGVRNIATDNKIHGNILQEFYDLGFNLIVA